MTGNRPNIVNRELYVSRSSVMSYCSCGMLLLCYVRFLILWILFHLIVNTVVSFFQLLSLRFRMKLLQLCLYFRMFCSSFFLRTSLRDLAE